MRMRLAKYFTALAPLELTTLMITITTPTDHGG